MGRPRKTQLFPVAVSIDAAAAHLSLPRASIVEALARGELTAHSGPGRRVRITVPELVRWVETWPRYEIKRRVS